MTETKVYFSQKKALISILMSLLILTLLIVKTIDKNVPVLVIFLFFTVGIVIIFIALRHFMNRKPQLVISETGLNAYPDLKLNWNQVISISISQLAEADTFLVIKYKPDHGGEEKTVSKNIMNLDISLKKLVRTLTQYSGQNIYLP